MSHQPPTALRSTQRSHPINCLVKRSQKTHLRDLMEATLLTMWSLPTRWNSLQLMHTLLISRRRPPRTRGEFRDLLEEHPSRLSGLPSKCYCTTKTGSRSPRLQTHRRSLMINHTVKHPKKFHNRRTMINKLCKRLLT